MLKVTEIFYSIQGESTYAGLPCIFVRLTDCNLRCHYCDTRYAYEEGRSMDVESALQEISKFNCALVEITGGEPLLQDETSELASKLIDQGKLVLVETNGTKNIDVLPEPVIRIMDIKCPGSGESEKTDWENMNRLRQADNVKFVISSRGDFDWSVHVVSEYHLLSKVVVLFSPAFGILEPGKLAQWILEAALPVCLHLQLHKYIWAPNRRGV
ncbi:MAG TPA: radical SAM protein [bacterium]